MAVAVQQAETKENLELKEKQILESEVEYILKHQRAEFIIPMLHTLVSIGSQRPIRYGYVATEAFRLRGIPIQEVGPAFDFFVNEQLLVPAGGKFDFNLTRLLEQLSADSRLALRETKLPALEMRAWQAISTSEIYKRAFQRAYEVALSFAKPRQPLNQIAMDRMTFQSALRKLFGSSGDRLMSDLIAMNIFYTWDQGRKVKLAPLAANLNALLKGLEERREVEDGTLKLNPPPLDEERLSSALTAPKPLAPAAKPGLAPKEPAPIKVEAPPPRVETTAASAQAAPPSAEPAPVPTAPSFEQLEDDVLIALELTLKDAPLDELQPTALLEGTLQDTLKGVDFKIVMGMLKAHNWINCNQADFFTLGKEGQRKLNAYREAETARREAELTPPQEMIALARIKWAVRIISALPQKGSIKGMTTEELAKDFGLKNFAELLPSLMAMQKSGCIETDPNYTKLPQGRPWFRGEKYNEKLVAEINRACKWLMLQAAPAGEKAEAAAAVLAASTQAQSSTIHPLPKNRSEFASYFARIGAGTEIMQNLQRELPDDAAFNEFQVRLEAFLDTTSEVPQESLLKLLRVPAFWETLASAESYAYIAKLGEALPFLKERNELSTIHQLTSVRAIQSFLSEDGADKESDTSAAEDEGRQAGRHKALCEDVTMSLQELQLRNDSALAAAILVYGFWRSGSLYEQGGADMKGSLIARTVRRRFEPKPNDGAVSRAIAELVQKRFIIEYDGKVISYRLNSCNGASTHPDQRSRAILERISSFYKSNE